MSFPFGQATLQGETFSENTGRRSDQAPVFKQWVLDLEMGIIV
ncbi:unnamed protein product, partial [marine sediment metagenome]